MKKNVKIKSQIQCFLKGKPYVVPRETKSKKTKMTNESSKKKTKNEKPNKFKVL